MKLSGVNNIEKHVFLDNHKFVPYCSITENVVTNFLTKFKINSETEKQFELHENVYCSLNEIKFFFIWSIIHFLKNNEIRNYWELSGVMTSLAEKIYVPPIRC